MADKNRRARAVARTESEHQWTYAYADGRKFTRWKDPAVRRKHVVDMKAQNPNCTTADIGRALHISAMTVSRDLRTHKAEQGVDLGRTRRKKRQARERELAGKP
jgi:hypothetical protein